jgi:hypothetical protein
LQRLFSPKNAFLLTPLMLLSFPLRVGRMFPLKPLMLPFFPLRAACALPAQAAEAPLFSEMRKGGKESFKGEGSPMLAKEKKIQIAFR